MASIHKTPKSQFWQCAYRLPDGKRTIRSTKIAVKGKNKEETQVNREKALRICMDYEQATRDATQGRLAEGQAREIIGRIYAIANTETLPQSTVKEFLELWLKSKAVTLAESSLAEYKTAVRELLAYLGDKQNRHMDTITLRELTGFRDAAAGRVSGTTVNKYVKILGGAWLRAMKDGLLRENPFPRVELASEDRAKRRAFTLDELKRVLAEADDEWRGMVLCGFYLGQRIGDTAQLTWRSVDFEANNIRLLTQKTKRPMTIPLATPLREYLLSLSASDNPDAPLFPRTASLSGQTLSNQFADILAEAKLQKARTHEKNEDGKGRSAERKASRLSFHCLRHTNTSLLHNAGVSAAVAQEIVGHDSAEVHRVYAHMEQATLQQAVNKLPDLVKDLPVAKGAK
ncbi:MAG: tyrosine-type recombinase/integrase [Verrucomicrobiota bacterium]